ncbi:MAG: hypothetical protein VX278_08270, partial [Myxococcota bacterium]|nr:hypothetical protein [Myxococcota bacterium]
MKLIVIDPGFASDEGHHYPMNAFISHQARALGYRSLIVGPVHYENNKIKKFRRPNFPCRFVLPNHGYEFPFSHTNSELYSIALNMFSFGRSNVGTEEALNKYIPINRLQDGDIILVHTAFLSSLHGIASWLTKADLPNIKIRIILRFPPWIYQKRKDISTRLFEETLAAWERIPAEVIFFTDVQVYTEYIEQRTSL